MSDLIAGTVGDKALVWLKTVADLLLWVACTIIPVVIFYVARKRSDLAIVKQRKRIWYLFGMFLLGCGLTHLFNIVILQLPMLQMAVLIRLVTAILAIATAGYLLYSLPRLLAVPSVQQLEEELKKSEEQFRRMADTIPQMAFKCDSEGTPYWYNSRWLEYTGISIERAQNGQWRDAIHPDDLNDTDDQWRLSVATGKPFRRVIRLRNQQGQYNSFIVGIQPFLDDDGSINRWFGTCTDISEQKAVEITLKESNERKDEFLAMLAHELRNPLAPIRNAVQLLRITRRDGRKVDGMQRAVEMIERQVNHMVRLVDDLLDVSRIQKGKINLKLEKIFLCDAIYYAIETVRPLIQQRNQHLQTAFPERKLFINGDPTRLAQCVANLLNNASKYTHEGGHIWITLEQNDGWAELRISDDGIGIPKEVLPKVFGLFVQSERALARSEGGLGIGLTLVERLVELHDGTVEARSAGIGRGSTFVIKLPLTDPPSENYTALPSLPKVEEDDTENIGVSKSSKTILVVDDNKDSAESLAMLLRTKGYRVYAVYDGGRAVEAAHNRHPDLILLDIGLPGMNGLEVCSHLKPQMPKVVFAAMTGYGSDNDKLKSREAGFQYHLVKPVDFVELEQILNKMEASHESVPG